MKLWNHSGESHTPTACTDVFDVVEDDDEEGGRDEVAVGEETPLRAQPSPMPPAVPPEPHAKTMWSKLAGKDDPDDSNAAAEPAEDEEDEEEDEEEQDASCFCSSWTPSR